MKYTFSSATDSINGDLNRICGMGARAGALTYDADGNQVDQQGNVVRYVGDPNNPLTKGYIDPSKNYPQKINPSIPIPTQYNQNQPKHGGFIDLLNPINLAFKSLFFAAISPNYYVLIPAIAGLINSSYLLIKN